MNARILWWQQLVEAAGEGVYISDSHGGSSARLLHLSHVRSLVAANEKRGKLAQLQVRANKLDVRGHDNRQGQAAGSPPLSTLHSPLHPLFPHCTGIIRGTTSPQHAYVRTEKKKNISNGQRRDSKQRSSETWRA